MLNPLWNKLPSKWCFGFLPSSLTYPLAPGPRNIMVGSWKTILSFWDVGLFSGVNLMLNFQGVSQFKKLAMISTGQTTIIPKPKLRGFGGDSLSKTPFKVTLTEIVIVLPRSKQTSNPKPSPFGRQSTRSTDLYGCFRKWWYPQIIQFNRDFHYKSSILEYPYFWKHPYPNQGTNLLAIRQHQCPSHLQRTPTSLKFQNFHPSATGVMMNYLTQTFRSFYPSAMGVMMNFTLPKLHAIKGNANQN